MINNYNQENNIKNQLETIGVYKSLEIDFDLKHCKDDWSEMDFNSYISQNFIDRFMGVVLDNSKYIKKVYTAVFPTEEIINKLLSLREKNILLFTHHPMSWDITKNSVFQNISPSLLSKMKEQEISLYTLHVPLDKNGEYSTSINLAKYFGIIPIQEFCEYFGVKVGVVGVTEENNINQLTYKFNRLLNHKVKLYKYGSGHIKDGKVAVVAGGGNDPDVVREVIGLGVNTFVTGVTRQNEEYKPSLEAHALLKENKINLIGATHYSTEKFACIEMVKYFNELGLPCEFLGGKPMKEDM